jgi:hypothetical protein
VRIELPPDSMSVPPKQGSWIDERCYPQKGSFTYPIKVTIHLKTLRKSAALTSNNSHKTRKIDGGHYSGCAKIAITMKRMNKRSFLFELTRFNQGIGVMLPFNLQWIAVTDEEIGENSIIKTDHLNHGYHFTCISHCRRVCIGWLVY